LKLFFGKDENFTTAFLSSPKRAQILTEAKFRESKLHDIVHLGVRVTIGVIFIVQGTGKFDPGVAGWLTSKYWITSRVADSNSFS